MRVAVCCWWRQEAGRLLWPSPLETLCAVPVEASRQGRPSGLPHQDPRVQPTWKERRPSSVFPKRCWTLTGPTRRAKQGAKAKTKRGGGRPRPEAFPAVPGPLAPRRGPRRPSTLAKQAAECPKGEGPQPSQKNTHQKRQSGVHTAKTRSSSAEQQQQHPAQTRRVPLRRAYVTRGFCAPEILSLHHCLTHVVELCGPGRLAKRGRSDVPHQRQGARQRQRPPGWSGVCGWPCVCVRGK